MSKHPSIPNVPLAASSRTNGCGRLALAAALLGALAVPALAQSQPAARVMPEKHFTIPPGALTPVVLKTEPDAACDLHEAGVSDPSKSMRLYGNVEGYVRLHFTPNQGAEDAHLQLDCTAQGVVTTHPVHLHIAASATDDMPAPASLIPAPAGSKIRPALTDDAARLLTDQELIAQSYPPRPDATKSPKAYARWLELASRPVTIVPPHSVSRSDISHARGVTEGPADNSHWSGFAATGPPFDYTAVSGEWNVPVVSNSCYYCYSSVWAGMDGAPTVANQDVVQAGTEQNSLAMGSGTATDYYAWTEAYPQQPTAQEIFDVSPGDPMFVFVFVGDSNGNLDPVGDYAWFLVQDLNPLAFNLYLAPTKL